jgi:hypothetical protein
MVFAYIFARCKPNRFAKKGEMDARLKEVSGTSEVEAQGAGGESQEVAFFLGHRWSSPA